MARALGDPELLPKMGSGKGSMICRVRGRERLRLSFIVATQMVGWTALREHR